jgi:hypothetical protein
MKGSNALSARNNTALTTAKNAMTFQSTNTQEKEFFHLALRKYTEAFTVFNY